MALDKDFKDKLTDRFDGWEIVEFLQISTEDVIYAFEEEIEDAIEDVADWLGVRILDDEQDDY